MAEGWAGDVALAAADCPAGSTRGAGLVGAAAGASVWPCAASAIRARRAAAARRDRRGRKVIEGIIIQGICLMSCGLSTPACLHISPLTFLNFSLSKSL